ncbi:unnamed protein product [Protopolystoma xenopodis]|uniref:AGC-kinase C-terminal domain-containing protein n=1 Tax=Protopolystoma xenopodis TaxID=117903 RepID=A0A3S5C590_9PLAT|nr:unnamed protein product [Protopolystoma xenopodis]
MHISIFQLLTKDPKLRLGSTEEHEKGIRDHAFFRRLDWEKIEARSLQPPYRPKIVCTYFLLERRMEVREEENSRLTSPKDDGSCLTLKPCQGWYSPRDMLPHFE